MNLGSLPDGHPQKVWGLIADIARQIDITVSGSTAYVFRGHANARWPIESPIVRCVNRPGITADELLKIESAATERFARQSHHFLSSFVRSCFETPFVQWAIMQHHGAATRLLDWTYSPYVAAYFAASQLPESDGVIHGIKGSLFQIPDTLKNLDGYSIHQAVEDRAFWKRDAETRLFILGSDLQTERMIAQQGVFMVCTNIAASIHKQIQALAQGAAKEQSFVIRIPAAVKPYLLMRLATMNISAYTLFPGLDGLSRSISEAMYMEAHRTPPGLDRTDPNHPHCVTS